MNKQTVKIQMYLKHMQRCTQTKRIANETYTETPLSTPILAEFQQRANTR